MTVPSILRVKFKILITYYSNQVNLLVVNDQNDTVFDRLIAASGNLNLK